MTPKPKDTKTERLLLKMREDFKRELQRVAPKNMTRFVLEAVAKAMKWKGKI